MYQIKTLNKISDIGLEEFDENYIINDENASPDAIIVRSASMNEMDFPLTLISIARAGAGVNNIPVERCSEKGIVVFNTPGANANAVKELAITALLLSSRKVYDGILWANSLNGDDVAKQVEKGKSQFVGPEIEGKTLGVIGLGAIGVMVANSAVNLGMEVLGYDPYISVDAAWGLSRAVQRAADLKTIFEKCDYISLHVPLTKETDGYINAEAIAQMKKGVRIINLSRGELVNIQDIKKALENKSVGKYVTDFPNNDLINTTGVIAIPHLGASTPESEENCAMMAAKQTIDFLENGNIKNSVNFPNCELGKVNSKYRITVAHRNIPNMLGQISTTLANDSINISNMLNKSKGDYAYTMIDVETDLTNYDFNKINAIEGVVKVRVL